MVLRNVTPLLRRHPPLAHESTHRNKSFRLFSSMKTSPGPVHILGLGNLGKLFAYSLAKCNKETPITLLFHRASLVPEWDKAGRSIEITTNGVSDRQTGYDYEVLDDTTANGHGPITSLIVATKTYLTVAALRPIKHRLSKDSTLLFLQNGMGKLRSLVLRQSAANRVLL